MEEIPTPEAKKKRKRKTYNSYVKIGKKKYPMTTWSMSGDWLVITNGSRSQHVRTNSVETFEVFSVAGKSLGGVEIPFPGPVVAGPKVSGGPAAFAAQLAAKAKARGEFDPTTDEATINAKAAAARRELDAMLRAGDGFASA